MSGGMRVGAGRPQKALEDKILDGDITRKEALEKDTQTNEAEHTLQKIDAEPITNDLPMTKDYMMADQFGGETLKAPEEIKDIYTWVFKMGCSKIVPTQLLEQYSMDRARWIQCQNAISESGFIVKSPKSGRPIKNPYIEIMINMEKQMNNTFLIINQMVREHCLSGYEEYKPNDAFYESLLD